MASISNLKSKFQSGVMMLEGLIAILIFSLGILAIVGLQAESVRNSSEAKYRADASFLVNQLIGRMWADRNNLASYQHRPTGAVCAPGGSASGYAQMIDWLDNVNNYLPQATETMQSVSVDAATGDVTVRICWSSKTGQHNIVVQTRIQG